MPKVMGYYRLWVVTEMGYDRVDCSWIMQMIVPDVEQEQIKFQYEEIRVHCFVPTIAEAEAMFKDIKRILKLPQKKGPGSVHYSLDEFTHSHIEAMRKFL